MAAGMENREITNEQITASSFMHQHHPSQGRLHNVLQRVNGSAVWGSWCTNTVDTSQYIQVHETTDYNIVTGPMSRESSQHWEEITDRPDSRANRSLIDLNFLPLPHSPEQNKQGF